MEARRVLLNKFSSLKYVYLTFKKSPNGWQLYIHKNNNKENCNSFENSDNCIYYHVKTAFSYGMVLFM